MPPKTPKERTPERQPQAGAPDNASGTALAQRLSGLRDEAAITNAELAARLGTTERRIGDLLSGAAVPSAGELAALAASLLAEMSSPASPAVSDDERSMASLSDVANRYFTRSDSTRPASTRADHEPAAAAGHAGGDGRGIEAASRYGEDLQMTRLFSLIEDEDDRAFLIALAGLMTQR